MTFLLSIFSFFLTTQMKSVLNRLVVMCGSASILLTAGYLTPEEHHPSYVKFLERFQSLNGASPALWRRQSPGTPLHKYVTRNENAFLWLMKTTKLCFEECLKIYFPLHLIVAGFKLPRLPKFSLFAENVMRSTLFLTTYDMFLMAALFLHSKILNGKEIPR